MKKNKGETVDMEMFIDILLDAAIDCVKMLPFLFLAFLLIEALEHYSSDFTKKLMVKVDKAGPVVGAIVGCVPQCGFSVMAANLYSGGIITVGTLIAVFLATSDEAILIIMGNPEHAGKIGVLLLAKVIIAIIAGYLVDIFFKKEIAVPHHEGELCHDCGCHNHSAGIVKPALRHTGKIFFHRFVSLSQRSIRTPLQQNVKSCLGKYLGNTMSHSPCSNNAYFHNR